jgi:hypothetical protein
LETHGGRSAVPSLDRNSTARGGTEDSSIADVENQAVEHPTNGGGGARYEEGRTELPNTLAPADLSTQRISRSFY